MTTLLYEGKGLIQRYGGREALNLPRLEVEAGSVLVLTGPNGCGKSTLLRLLAFLERPAAGELRFNPPDGARGTAAARRQVSLLLQEPYLLRMSVERNVLLGPRLRGRRLTRAEARRLFVRVMGDVGFAAPEDFAGRGPAELSGGERQRVALAAHLALDLPVLLLDEPTANVDAASARAIASAISAANRRGAAVICATHDPALIRALNARELRLGRAWDEG